VSGPRPSRGEIPRNQTLLDANQAVALLATMHNWSCSMTQDGDTVRYSVSVRQAGRRGSGYGRDFLSAVQNALGNIKDKPDTRDQPALRLTRSEE